MESRQSAWTELSNAKLSNNEAGKYISKEITKKMEEWNKIY